MAQTSPSEFRNNINAKSLSSGSLLFGLKNKIRPHASLLFIQKNFPLVYSKQLELRANDGLSGNYQWIRLHEACKLIRKYNVNSVMEFGSGGSTSLFDSMQLARVDTFEQKKKYYERTLQCLIGHGKTHLHLSDSEYISNDGLHFSQFEQHKAINLYQEFEHDMLYIDGPTAKVMIENSKYVMTINADTINILRRGYRPKLILIDARPETTSFLFNNYYEEYNCVLRNSYLPAPQKYQSEYYYHSFMLRKDLA